jgi:hypothetical protein
MNDSSQPRFLARGAAMVAAWCASTVTHPRDSVSGARLLPFPMVVACLVGALAAPALAARPVNSIAGTWLRVIHCQDVVRALTAAGFG